VAVRANFPTFGASLAAPNPAGRSGSQTPRPAKAYPMTNNRKGTRSD
jgi:hypothetical protein